jgi:hypothetical protein
MDTYRSVVYNIEPSNTLQVIKASHAQRSQRYQKLVLLSNGASITFSKVGFGPIRPDRTPKALFRCSDDTLNQIWADGVRTVDMCSLTREETAPGWEVTDRGTKVHGQHWAPCRHGTRWTDKIVTFEVLIERGGASWGINMIVNGLIFCLNAAKNILSAYEGLADQKAVFPSTPKGIWHIGDRVPLNGWLNVRMISSGCNVKLSLNNAFECQVDSLAIRPILGGDINSGSIAFGGPQGWTALYRNLIVKGPQGETLYQSSLSTDCNAKTMADFQVGTNLLPCTIDGAKRDRACFGGDLFITGRSIAYSAMDLECVAGTIELLTSHQMPDGYLGNLCPAQAPLHTEDSPPPTYAFYSITYALLLVVAI